MTKSCINYVELPEVKIIYSKGEKESLSKKSIIYFFRSSVRTFRWKVSNGRDVASA